MVGHGGIVAFDEPHRHARRRPPPAALRRRRELRQVLPVPDRAAARARDVRRRRAGRPRAARGAAGDARARQPVRPRRRHAGADPQPARALPGGAGARSDHGSTIDGERGRGRAGHDRARGGPRPPAASPDALLRRAPGAVRRLPRLPGRRRGRARRRVAACTTPCRDGMEVDTHDADRAPRRRRRRRAGALRAARAARPSTPSWPQVARCSSVGEPRWPGEQHDAARTTSATRTWPSSTSCASRAGAACARATRSRARSR